MILIWLLGCGADLLPGEVVLGDEHPAITIEGSPGSGFGAAVAVTEGDGGELRVLVGAPDVGEVTALDAQGDVLWSVRGEVGLGTRVGWHQGRPWAWAPGGEVLMDIDQSMQGASTDDSTAVTVCPDGEVLTRSEAGADIACASGGRIATACEGTACTVERSGSQIDQEVTSAGSAVGFWGSTACFGDARIAQEEAPGGVWCEDGVTVEGLPGDHLGLAIAGGRAAGVFNRHIRPPRARIVSLDDGDVWAVDRAAERSRIALGAGGGIVAVGVPGFGQGEAREGRVFLVQVDQ